MRNTCKSDGVRAFGDGFSGGRVRNTWMTYRAMGDTPQKWGLRPHALALGDRGEERQCRKMLASGEGSAAD